MVKEEVLCVLREQLPEAWIKSTSAISMERELCFAAIEQAGYTFMPRQTIEENPRYKQIIPYVIVREQETFTFASYKRGGSESRLHDLTSCGIGGHIGRNDALGECDNLEKIVNRSMKRELTEEFVILPSIESLSFLGVINEDETPVGSVHLGLVFLLEIKSRQGVVPGSELKEFTWCTWDELKKMNLELWSHLALNFVEG
ncbi:MAG: hypothetical protein N2572_00585 [Syntrophales bacterium]|nr:hypothetical protein [Syntrophales bacterium]